MMLYPKIPRCPKIIGLAEKYASMSVEECKGYRNTTHSLAEFTATGGVKAPASHLENIASGLTDIAIRHGYPEEKRRRNTVDAEWAEYLHKNMDTNAHEAASDGMWHFMTCVLLPDLVRWRWGGLKEESVSDRWVTVRHRGRNCFGRLWWRAEVLYDDNTPGSPYQYVHALGEDELVQIMERPVLAGNRLLSRITAEVLLKISKGKTDLNRSLLLREYQKRMLRLGAFTDFYVLDETATRGLVNSVFNRTLSVMRKTDIDVRKAGNKKGLLDRTISAMRGEKSR